MRTRKQKNQTNQKPFLWYPHLIRSKNQQQKNQIRKRNILKKYFNQFDFLFFF